MNLMKEIMNLCSLCGISGDEGPVRAYLMEKIRTFPDILEMRVDALGNLLVHKKGNNPAKHTLLIGAHMDEVGLIVTDIQDDGLCTVAPVGGVDADRIFSGLQELGDVQRVGVHPRHLLHDDLAVDLTAEHVVAGD